MSDYMPEVGHKVRATRDENVLVGQVEEMYAGGGIEIGIGGSGFIANPNHGWKFERIQELPTKFGAVIQRADGELFILAEPSAADNCSWFGAGSGWHRARTASEGGFSVLFDGVDE